MRVLLSAVAVGVFGLLATPSAHAVALRRTLDAARWLSRFAFSRVLLEGLNVDAVVLCATTQLHAFINSLC
jgi:hypothetical protein